MTYNDWRDELKSNLLSVSDEERRRVLDYYAEAYADRREAGYSEKEIIRDFGAPYDAAQRILLNICDDAEYIEETQFREKKVDTFEREEVRYTSYKDDFFDKSKNDKKSKRVKEVEAEIVADEKLTIKQKAKAHPFLCAILILVLVILTFPLIAALFGIFVAILVSPLILLGIGVANISLGIVEAFSDIMSGVYTIGVGLLVLGIFIAITPFLIKLVKLVWVQIKKMFAWLTGRVAKEGKKYE